MSIVATLAYLVAASLFIVGLKMLGKASTARRGNLISSIGMLIAVLATLIANGTSFPIILAGIVVGSGIGAFAAKKVDMTSMPQLVALFNGFGGASSTLVALSEWDNLSGGAFQVVSIALALGIGCLTFTGSIIAFGKLAEWLSGSPVLFSGQKALNGLLALGAIVSIAMMATDTYQSEAGWALLIITAILGVSLVIPIGGADMPVVICLLNSYSGLAACATGFVVSNIVLIVSGALVGSSGIILTHIMCKAMNRTLGNVIFGGVGASSSGGKGAEGTPNPISSDDAYYLLEAADSVVFIPGYGMAVAQAQHAVRELTELLELNNTEVSFCIHPVAGRMPGHMNVLLAEANVPYDQLVEPDDTNPTMETVDVAVVIGANDVVNPAAREDETSPLYGMPIIDADKAKVCMVLKRSMKAGFAGVDNPLFVGDNTRMLFGDAKSTISELANSFKENAAKTAC